MNYVDLPARTFPRDLRIERHVLSRSCQLHAFPNEDGGWSLVLPLTLYSLVLTVDHAKIAVPMAEPTAGSGPTVGQILYRQILRRTDSGMFRSRLHQYNSGLLGLGPKDASDAPRQRLLSYVEADLYRKNERSPSEIGTAVSIQEIRL